jgi:hypothetical protein
MVNGGMNRFLAVLSAGVVALWATNSTIAATLPDSPAEFYVATNVWTVHLRFTPEQWAAMEPAQSEGGGGFRPPGQGGDDGRDSFLQGAPGKRNGLASAMGWEFKYVHADLEIGGVKFPDVGVRYKGNGTYMESQGGMKRPLKVDLNKFVKGRKVGGATTLDFQNNVTDAGMMNDTLAYRFFRDAGVPAPRTAYAKVYVSVPGLHTNTYVGLYTTPQNVDAQFAKDHFGTKDGLVLKPVTSRPFTDLGTNWSKYAGPYDPKTKASDAQKARVMEFARFVSNATDTEFAKRLGEYLDVEEFARFMAATVWLSNFDSLLDMGQNYYVHLDPKSNRFAFIPWDLDHSFGSFGMRGSQQTREQLSLQRPWSGSNRLLERIFAVEDFKQRYRANLEKIQAGIGQPERIGRQISEVAAAIRPAVAEEGSNALARFDKVVAGEAVPGGGPGGGRRGWGPGFGATKPVRTFVVARHAAVAEQLSGKTDGLEMSNDGPFGGRPDNAFLAKPILVLADADHDGKVSSAELTALAERWFKAWDNDQEGEIRQSQLGKGLGSAFNKLPPGTPAVDSAQAAGLAPIWSGAMDANRDRAISHDEFIAAFARWFGAWDAAHTGSLDEAALKRGMDRDWAGGRRGGPGGPGPR